MEPREVGGWRWGVDADRKERKMLPVNTHQELFTHKAKH